MPLASIAARQIFFDEGEIDDIPMMFRSSEGCSKKCADNSLFLTKEDKKRFWSTKITEPYHGMRGSAIRKGEARRLAQQFCLKHDVLDGDVVGFLDDINYRLCIEVQINPNARSHEERKEHPEVFARFMRYEAHYEAERKGFEWDEKESKFKKMTPEQYDELVKSTYDAFVRRAVKFFETSTVKGGTDNFRMNLRGSLKDYYKPENPLSKALDNFLGIGEKR